MGIEGVDSDEGAWQVNIRMEHVGQHGVMVSIWLPNLFGWTPSVL